MAIEDYKRTLEELRSVASLFWPQELSIQASELSIIPKLLETQDQFIAMLSVELTNQEDYFRLLSMSRMPTNLFLKHLVVLADFGGEPLQRLNDNFSKLFPSGEMRYFKNGAIESYNFIELPVQGRLTNDRCGISGRKLLEPTRLTELQKDVMMILFYGSAIEDEEVASTLQKCEIGNYLGKHTELERFVHQRYIWVSRITGGATVNQLGQLAQKYVKDYLNQHLSIPGVTITPNGSIPDIRDRESTPAKFDVVVSNEDKYVGIEVSFQVTTNSTIERKANQAQDRYQKMNRKGYLYAYVIDGAGNFQRESSVRTLCNYSDCAVAYSNPELDILIQCIREYFSQNH